MRPRQGLALFDFRGGVNRSHSVDVLTSNELRRAGGARLGPYGAVSKRTGSRRLHTSALAGGVQGAIQWDAPSGSQIVAVAGGKLHHKLTSAARATDFAQVATPTPHATNPVRFAAHREGSAILLYIADGAQVFEFDGANLAAVAGSPAATDLALYKLRIFGIDGTKTLYATAISDADEWGTANGAFVADVETFDTDGLVRILTVGSSLLVFKANNIARLTGASSADLKIDTDTEGVSAEVGCIAPASLVAFEGACFFLSDRGPYIATEAGVQAVGTKIEPEIDRADPSDLAAASAVHHRGRREIWLRMGAEVWVWSYRTMAWSGPWPGTCASPVLARYELPTGEERVLSGGADGFLREEDVQEQLALDDVLADGGGGSAITFDAELPPLLFSAPHVRKSMTRMEQHIEADLGAGATLAVGWSSEMGSGSSLIRSAGAGVRDYSTRIRMRGKRPRLTLKESSSAPVQINGLALQAALGRQTA